MAKSLNLALQGSASEEVSADEQVQLTCSALLLQNKSDAACGHPQQNLQSASKKLHWLPFERTYLPILVGAPKAFPVSFQFLQEDALLDPCCLRHALLIVAFCALLLHLSLTAHGETQGHQPRRLTVARAPF